jgi:hypothetical protein
VVSAVVVVVVAGGCVVVVVDVKITGRVDKFPSRRDLACWVDDNDTPKYSLGLPESNALIPLKALAFSNLVKSLIFI